MRRVRLALIVATLLAGSALVYAQANCVIINGVSSCGGVFSFLAGLKVSDGTAAAPPIAFASQPASGFYHPGTNYLGFSPAGAIQFAMGGNTFIARSDGLLAWTSTTDPYGGTQDTKIGRAAAGAVNIAHVTATSTAELQVSGGNGGFISAVKALTELTTIAAAATTTTAIQIPANAVALAVSVRVVTVIPTAATFTVTSATPAKTWNTVAVAVAANTTDKGTAPGPTFQTTASGIVITPNLTPGAATGQVRVTIYYYEITPATS